MLTANQGCGLEGLVGILCGCLVAVCLGVAVLSVLQGLWWVGERALYYSGIYVYLEMVIERGVWRWVQV